MPRLRENRNLALLEEKSVPAIGRRKASIAILLLFGIIVTAMAGVVPPPISLPVAAFLAILLGCINLSDAYQTIDWSTIITLDWGASSLSDRLSKRAAPPRNSPI